MSKPHALPYAARRLELRDVYGAGAETMQARGIA